MNYCRVQTKTKLGIHTTSKKTNIVLHGSGRRTMLTPCQGQLLDGKEIIAHWDQVKEGQGAPYLINRKGTVYSLYEPECWSYHTGLSDTRVDKQTIPVMLATELALEKQDNCFYLNGYIHSTNQYLGKVRTFRWRGVEYWATISPEQIDALLFVLHDLCSKFSLAKNIILSPEYNIKALEKATIVYHSNINKTVLDFPPMEDWVIAKIKDAGFQLID